MTAGSPRSGILQKGCLSWGSGKVGVLEVSTVVRNMLNQTYMGVLKVQNRYGNSFVVLIHLTGMY